MAPMKAMKGGAGIRSRCNSVRKAIGKAQDCPARVKKMLINTIGCTIGTPTADRYSFNQKFVTMFEQVLTAERARLDRDVASKEAAFAELSPAKGVREAALEQAKASNAEKAAALDQAKAAVAESAPKVKEAAAALDEAKKAQKSGNEEVEGLRAQRKTVEDAANESLSPLISGTAGDDKENHVKAVAGIGKTFAFDASLMSTAMQVFNKEHSERGGFDAIACQQLKEAFDQTVAKFDTDIAGHGPAEAERAAAVGAADAAHNQALATLADLKEKLAAAKQAKAEADAAQKAAAKSLHDFMPELKACGDRLDEAKKDVERFESGPRTALGELKDFKPEDFVKKSYYEKIDGLSCDRAVIDACREGVAAAADGRVSMEAAQKVFAKIADGGKRTRAERWTMRYCLNEFSWAEAAHDWIIEERKKVPAERPTKKARTAGSGYYETVDGYKCDRGIINACREAVAAVGDGRISREGAEAIWAKAADGNKVTNAEKWTLRYCLSEFAMTRSGHDYLIEQLKAVGASGAVGAS